MDVIEAYRRYAALRGWRWVAVKVLVTVGLALLVGGFWTPGAQIVLTIAIVDAYVKRPVRDGRPLRDVGLDPGRGLRDTAWGFGLGALLVGGGIGVLAAAGWYRVVDFEGRWGWFLAFVGVFAVVSVFEEVLARGMLLRFLERYLGSWAALGLSSVVFGLVHLGNPGATVISTLALAAEAGIVLGAAYLATRSLWVPIGIHWSWNLVEGPVFGTLVSGTEADALLDARVRGPTAWTGGSFGPEGGLALLLVGLAAGLVFLVLAIRRGRMRAGEGVPRLGGRSSTPAAGGEEGDEHLAGGE